MLTSGEVVARVRVNTATEVGPAICAAAIFTALLVPLPFVLNSHWFILDDQIIVAQMAWPPDSPTNIAFHHMGRDITIFGIWFKLLSLFSGTNPLGYYLANYLIYAVTIVMLTVAAWLATRDWVLTALAGMFAAFASSGPEVFLTLFKTEEPMMFFVALFVLLLARERAHFFALVTVAFLSATFGKETAVPLFAGGIAGLTVAWIKIKNPDQRQFVGKASGGAVCGILLVFVYRLMVGVASPSAGSYSINLLTGKNFHDISGAANIYMLVASDVCLALIVACFVGLVALLFRHRPTPVGLFALGAALGVAVFQVGMIAYLQIYYFYPIGLLAPLAIACLVPEARSLRIAAGAALAFLLLLALPEYRNRLLSHHYVPATHYELLAALSHLPQRSIVALPYATDSEMARNVPILLATIWNRPDLKFVFGPNEGAQYIVVLFEGENNYRIGGRGLYNLAAKPPNAWLAQFKIASNIEHGGVAFALWIPPRLGATPMFSGCGSVTLSVSWEIERVG